jgi:hypothetical protein
MLAFIIYIGIAMLVFRIRTVHGQFLYRKCFGHGNGRRESNEITEKWRKCRGPAGLIHFFSPYDASADFRWLFHWKLSLADKKPRSG